MEPVIHNKVVTGVNFGGGHPSPLTPDIQLDINGRMYPLKFNMAAHRFLLGVRGLNLIAQTDVNTVSDPDNMPYILYAMAVSSNNFKDPAKVEELGLTVDSIAAWLDEGLRNMDEAVTAIMFVIMKSRAPEELVLKAQSLAPPPMDDDDGPAVPDKTDP